ATPSPSRRSEPRFTSTSSGRARAANAASLGERPDLRTAFARYAGSKRGQLCYARYARQEKLGQRTAPKKMAASETEAAKFREETPRKGGGFAGGPAIPRCNN